MVRNNNKDQLDALDARAECAANALGRLDQLSQWVDVL